MKNIGFIINPVAGMGGAVGLKGTDGQYDRAVALGAEPVAGIKARMMLEHLDTRGITFFTAGGSMGADALESAGVSDYHIVYTPTTPGTTADDTIKACRAITSIQKERGTAINTDITTNADTDTPIHLIVFCGGDGTARDIFSVTGPDIPVLGVPAGVKMYSAVFAVNPAAAAELIQKFTPASCTDAEVMDVDENAYRRGELSTRVYGIAQTPTLPNLRQSGKLVSVPADDRRARSEIAEFIPEIMRDDTLYILGAGTTTGAISEALGISGTLLGVDAIYKGVLIAADLNEEGILELLNRDPDTRTNSHTHAPTHTYPRVKIILSPIGAQGFVLGRGNQQISPEVIRRAGHENIIVVATPAKLSRTPTLYIDTGDESLNGCFGDSLQVICGYRMAQRVKLLHS